VSIAPSNEVMANEIAHIRATTDRTLALLETKASREEVHSGDAALSRRVDAVEADGRAKDTRIRALEDERTGLRAILALLGFFGVAGAAALVKWLVSY